jgi:hypothetical protein
MFLTADPGDPGSPLEDLDLAAARMDNPAASLAGNGRMIQITAQPLLFVGEVSNFLVDWGYRLLLGQRAGAASKRS